MIFHNRKTNKPVIESAFLSEEHIPESLAFESLFDGSEDVVHTALIESMSAMYHGVCAQDQSIIMEGFKDMASKAYNFFKDLLKKIANFIKNSFDLLESYILDFDKFIAKHEMDVTKFKPFEVQGFDYSISDSPVDNCGIDKVVNGYNSYINKIKTLPMGDIQKKIADAKGRDSMSALRGKLAGESGMVKADRFDDALFKRYRGGKSSKHTIKVDAARVNNMIIDYRKFKSLVKEVKADGNNVQSLFNDLAEFFNDMPKYDYESSDHRTIRNYHIDADPKNGTAVANKSGEDDEYSMDLYKKMGAWYNFCFNMSKDIAYMYSKAYNAKVSALKEALSFNRGVIRQALSPFADKKGEGDK